MGVWIVAKQEIEGFLRADIETTVLEKEAEFMAEGILQSMTPAERAAFNRGRQFQENLDVAFFEAYQNKKS
jgi:hypothetical protein